MHTIFSIFNNIFSSFICSLIVNNSTAIDTSFPALLAPFLAFIYGPSPAIFQLNQKLGCTRWSQGVVSVLSLQKYRSPLFVQCFVDCTRMLTLPSVTLTIQGRNYTLEPNDYVLVVFVDVCLSAFLSDPLKSKTPDNQSVYWTLGNPFVAKYVSHLDCQNNSIGLATKIPIFRLPV